MGQKLVGRREHLRRPAGGSAGNERRKPRKIAGASSRGKKTIGQVDLAAESFPIVGVGASAGGLEAFTQLLRDLPFDIDLALVLVQHLDPTYKSLLTELLSKTTKLHVAEVTEGMRVAPRHVYVIPPNTSMTISKGLLHLTPRIEVDRKHMPIDHFFESLARDQKNRAIGIILSGTSLDGVQGLKAIKIEGGITIAQDEKSAKYYDLPKNAIASGHVDLVLSPKEMAGELARLSQHHHRTHVEREVKDTLPPNDLGKIFAMIKKSSGVDFKDYKRATIKRRILRRMMLAKTKKMEDYLKYLQVHPSELDSLFQDILIHVTGFFREPATFEALKNEVFPSILKNRSAEESIRIWIPGCSTGEEVYSVAISLLEYLDNAPVRPPIQIFATDVNENVLELARQGVYSAPQSISQERLRRFFVKTNSSYQINKIIRRMCIFAKQNVTADPPFSKLDLIICRNLLIYLGPTLQRRLLPIFHYALKPTGFLVLGEFEAIGEFVNLFKSTDRRYKIYSKKPVITRTPLDFAMGQLTEPADIEKPVTGGTIESLVSEPITFKEADRVLLTKYSPASVIVNSEMEIIQFRGRTGLFLEPAPGRASLNVLKMAREGMIMDLRTAIETAMRKGETVRREGISTKSNGKYVDVNLEVVPLKAQPDHPCFLVTFEEAVPRVMAQPPQRHRDAEPKIEPRKENINILRLERELSANKDYLQSVIEDKEAANEELRAANEEIQSSNEELQSTNEELETAKEELQSTNEELTTINEELQNRFQELTQVNNDMTNLNASANVPIIMLGNDQRVRRWGPLGGKMFNLKPGDIGKPISDINLGLEIPDLRGTVNEAVDNGTSKEIEAANQNGRWFLVRIRPYRTLDNRIEGAVLAFVDIDRMKKIEEKLKAHSEHLEELVEQRTRMLGDSTRMAAIGETAGMVGHDLRNPLQTIINTIHLAKASLKEADSSGPKTSFRVDRALETIREQADFMNKIVSDLQDYARQPKPTFVEYDLQGLISDTLSSISIPSTVEISSSIEPGLPKLTLDPSLLRRAFTNIVSNAIQAMPSGGKLKIEAWANETSAAVSFQDTGNGMSDEVKARIFNPLFTTRERGVGLGLAVTKRLIESHNGEIKVSSKLGEGTTFTIEIPLNPGGVS